MEQWDQNYYITAIAGANNGSSLVVMSKGWWTCLTPIFLNNACDNFILNFLLLHLKSFIKVSIAPRPECTLLFRHIFCLPKIVFILKF